MAKIPGVHVPAEVKNLAINGAFDYWQRVEGNTTTFNSVSTGSDTYTADMVTTEFGGTSTHNFSIARSSTVPTLAQSGFSSTYSYLMTVVTGLASFSATDFVVPFEYRMEGLDYERIAQKTITVGFWFIASIAGTYTLALQNDVPNRSYVTTFNVASGSTWQYISKTIPLDTGGTWQTGNTLSMKVHVAPYCGTTYQTSSLNQWLAGNFFVASTSTNYMATTGATFNVAQLSIAESSLGFSATGFQRAGKTIQQELALCQRYYCKSYDIGTVPGTVTNNGIIAFATASGGGNLAYSALFPSKMRAVPTLTPYNPATGSTSTPSRGITGSTNNSIAASYVGMTGAAMYVSAPTGYDYFGIHWTADAGL